MERIKKFYHEYLEQADLVLFLLCVAATLFGILLISSTVHFSGNTKYILIQTISLVIGIAAYFLLSLIDIDIITEHWGLIFILSVGFIASLYVFGEGADDTGNKAWIRFAGIGIQPAEVVKIPFTILLGRLIINLKRRFGIGNIIALGILALFFGVFFGLIVVISSDLGTALVYSFIFLFTMFIAGLQIYWYLIAAGAVLAVFPYFWNHFLSESYRQRILVPYVPSVDPTGLGKAWQASQSKRAIANGGVFGQGLFNGTQTQTGRVPQQHTDFIFSVACEEMGIVGGIMVIAILAAIIIRVLWVGVKSNSTIGLYVCSGMAAMLIFQMLENIGMCLGLTPVIGLTLPFFSYGGSSVVTTFAAMGVVSGIKMRPQSPRANRI